MIPQPAPPARLVAIDWMRGLVMVLMTVDHASDVFNRNLVQAESYAFGAAGQDLAPFGSPLHFLTRWVTHLCAPTFVFLAGTALALSVERRLARGAEPGAVDRHLLARGLVLVLLELWMALAFSVPALQVLYAIGASLACMVLLRRLPSSALLVGALALMVFAEALVVALGWKPELTPQGPPPSPPMGVALLLTGGFYFLPGPFSVGPVPMQGFWLVLYPLLGWLPMLVLGWVFGRWLLACRDAPGRDRRAARLLASWGAAGLAVFIVQRLWNGYGNYWLPRTDGTWLRWLQLSKYPPSLAYAALELGLMALLLAVFFRVQEARGSRVRDRGPLLVFGQTALFFYLLHIHLMASFCALAFGGGFMRQPFGLAAAWLGAAGTLVVMYPLCLAYRRYKRARPGGWTRYL